MLATAVPVTALDTAVPGWMLRLSGLSVGERRRRARVCAAVVYEAGGPGGAQCRGIPSPEFDALAEWLAHRALRPGGVDYAGRHWSAP